MWATGINAITGIIPECSDHHDINNFSRIRAPVDCTCRDLKNLKGDPKSKSWGKCYHPPVIPAVGSYYGVPKYTAPTYHGIGTENTVHDPRDYEVIHQVEITPEMDVRLNGILIAGAPQYRQMKNGKSKKITETERARFCRGVIWFLLNDDTCLIDKLNEIGYTLPVRAPVDIRAHDDLTGITGSPYPGPGVIAESDQVDEDPFVRADIEEMTGTNYTDPADEGYDIPGQIEGMESPAEIIAAFCPAISAKTVNRYAYLRLTITEEPIITENMGTPIFAHNAGGVPA